MLQVSRCASASVQRACRAFLARDPVANVLVLGDLYQPLLRVSDLYVAFENSDIVGVCSIYRAFKTPSLVFSAVSAEVKQALIQKALGDLSRDFISLCQPNDAELFLHDATILTTRHEQQMATNSCRSTFQLGIKVSKVNKCELELLNRFYVEHRAEAWAPIQFETRPYYCVKEDAKIVSAAGVHLVTPQIAQLGNIATENTYRNRGFATACTATLTKRLASKGRIVSLFVRIDNAPAIHLYEKLGFVKKRDIAFLVMRKTTE